MGGDMMPSMCRGSSKNFSYEIKLPFESGFDYRNQLLPIVFVMYAEAVYGMIKKLPDEDGLDPYFQVGELWKSDDKQFEIFQHYILPKLEKKIRKLVNNEVTKYF